ncbi:hypothetical protein ROHU_029076 [Labeo rohita]|uniref:Uncharacterized protein n=1 Tax=Labeo rohita TaxID=84645 RepID=A0A498LTQ2_LABRO|nr:hypothetical protein ROHU_030265 [Labeo rohita]RXN13317.1 hypothetical protein ROHU_029076 [Labeo rohita]
MLIELLELQMNVIDTDLLCLGKSALVPLRPLHDKLKINATFAWISTLYEAHIGESFIGEHWLPEQLAKLSNRSRPRVPDCPTAAPSVLTVQRVSRPRRVWTGDTIEPFVH